MESIAKRFLPIVFFLIIPTIVVSCGSGGGGDGSTSQGGNTTNAARFYFDCDLQGLIGKMVMDIEIIGSSGITWGPGPDPQISGVIATGEYTIYTEGELNSPTANYAFTGENQYADFTEVNTFERFRVQWVEETNGLTMIVNPFGPGPTQHYCELTNSERL
jgi:hypothetical protein